MGGVKKGVKNFRKGQAKAAKQGLNPANSFNKGARSKPRQEVKLDEVEIEEKLLKVKRKDKEAVASTGTMKGHKEEMGNLEEMDPEFFDFLKKNDQSLLDFGDGESEDDEGEDGEDSDEDEDGLDDMEDDADSEDEEEEVKARKPRKERQAVEVTEKLLKETVSKAKKGNLQALKKTLAIFRSACVPNGGEDVDDVDEEEGETVSKFIIGSAHVYELVMYSVLDSAFVAFYSILDLPAQGKPTKEQLASLGGHERWKRTQLLVLSFFKSYMQVLGGLAKGAGNKPLIDGDEKDESAANVLVYLLQAIEPYIPLLAAMPRLGKALLKVFLYIWAEGPDPANDSKSRRARAFLRIRQMAVQLPGSYTEECFRCLYLSYTRCCKTFTEYTGASVLFMSRCIVELYQTDLQQAYQQSFLYIRQLALHLRSAVMKKSSESIRQITSWQFLNCLRLWTRVVIAMPKEDELGALAFPLSQVMSGVMASAQSIYSLPARFHIIQCLQLIAAHCQCFVPTVHKMLEVLEHPDIVTGKPSSSTDVAPKLQFSVKLPNDSVSRAPVRDLLVNEALVLIRHDAEIYRHHVGFPEYTYITVRKLKAFAKGAKVAKWRDMARTTAGQLESYAKEAKRERAKLGLAPVEVNGFEPLLKTGGASSGARLSKLLQASGRGFTAITEISIAAHNAPIKAPAGQAAAAKAQKEKKGAKGKAAMDEDDEEESEEGDSEDDDEEDEEEDEDSEEEEEAGAAKKSDKVGNMDVDSFFD